MPAHRPLLVLTAAVALGVTGCGGGTNQAADRAPSATETPPAATQADTPRSTAPAPPRTSTTPAKPMRPAEPAPTGTLSDQPVTVTRQPATQPRLVGVRTGHHATFDRVVFEFAGPAPGYDVRYVGQLVQDGSGATVPVEGQRVLAIAFTPAAAHDAAGNPTAPARIRTGYPSLREVVRVGDFEGVVSYGFGLDDRVGFRVFTLSGPTRVVIDVAG